VVQFYLAFSVLVLSLIWGLISLVLLSVSTHDAHDHLRINIVFGLIIFGWLYYYIVEDISMYNDERYILSDGAY
jgi:hypothetical protein